MAFIPSGMGSFLQRFGQDLQSYPQLKYEREQDALKNALTTRKLDIDERGLMQGQELKALQQALSFLTQQQTQADRVQDNDRAVLQSLPGGSMIDDRLAGSATKMGFGDLVSKQLPQLASTEIGGAMTTPEIGKQTLGIAAEQENPALPGGNRWAGSANVQNAGTRINNQVEQFGQRFGLSQENAQNQETHRAWQRAHPPQVPFMADIGGGQLGAFTVPTRGGLGGAQPLTVNIQMPPGVAGGNASQPQQAPIQGQSAPPQPAPGTPGSQLTRPNPNAGGAGSAISEEYLAERQQRALSKIDDLIKNTNWQTVGAYGGAAQYGPQTAARKYAADLRSLQASISMMELVEMRAASKTGGALGNVSNQENAMLADALAGFDQLMEPKDMITNLKKARESLARWEAAKLKHANEWQAISRGIMQPQQQQQAAPQANPYGLGY